MDGKKKKVQVQGEELQHCFAQNSRDGVLFLLLSEFSAGLVHSVPPQPVCATHADTMQMLLGDKLAFLASCGWGVFVESLCVSGWN